MATSTYRKQFPGSAWCCRGHSEIQAALVCRGGGAGEVVRIRADGSWRPLNGKERREARDILGNSHNVVGDRLADLYAD